MLKIKNVRMINPAAKTDIYGDITIDGDKVLSVKETVKPEGKGEKIWKEDAEGNMVLDGAGLVAAPGLVDVHTHFRDPGFTYKEDIASGAKAAAAGGYTTVIMMCNTKPAIDSTETLAYCLEKGRETGIHVLSCGAVTTGLKGEKLTPMEDMKEAGAVGFTDDGIPILDEELLREAFIKAAELSVPVSLHEEDPALIGNNGINRGAASAHFGISGSPREAEITMIDRDLKVALETGAIVNIQHISTKEGVELVRKAKAIPGNHVHAEATPHHIALTEQDVIKKGTLAKVNPPIRAEEDRQAILAGLKDGTIDIIATDHAPHAPEEKAKELTQAPSGMLGLETALPLALKVLREEAGMSLMEILEKLTCNPADMYHLSCGRLEEGKAADLVLFDPDEEWVLTKVHSKSENTPFMGERLKGKIYYTICAGKIVYAGE